MRNFQRLINCQVLVDIFHHRWISWVLLFYPNLMLFGQTWEVDMPAIAVTSGIHHGSLAFGTQFSYPVSIGGGYLLLTPYVRLEALNQRNIHQYSAGVVLHSFFEYFPLGMGIYALQKDEQIGWGLKPSLGYNLGFLIFEYTFLVPLSSRDILPLRQRHGFSIGIGIGLFEYPY